MAIDELTDAAFFDLYQKNPQVKGLVEDIQKRYHVHSSQTNEPDPKNVSAATKEAKDVIKQLINKEQKHGTHSTAPEKVSEKSEYAAWLLGGLATILGFATYPLLGATALLTTTLMMYNNYQNKYKTA